MSLSVDKVLRQAQSHLKAGELAAAETLYKQVLSKFPKNKKAIQGYQKLKAGITSKSTSSSEPPQDQVQELINLYSQGQFEKVLEKAKPLISLFPKAIELYNLQGASNALLERNGAAIESYNQAIQINPKYADAHLNKGSVLQEKGELDAAIESFNKALSINPYHSIAHFNKGNALKEKGELDSAVESYKKAIKIKPDYAESYFNMGIVLENKGGLDAAIEIYKQAIKINPDHAEAYNNMGNALKDKGEKDAAIESYKQAIKIKPDYADAYYNMGNALKGMKFSRPISELPEIIVSLLNKNTYVRPSDIALAAISLIKLDKVFQSVLNRYFSGELEQTLEQSISELSRIPLLIKMMELCPLPNLEIEWLLTYLRSGILNNVSQLSGSKETLAFQTALALQCFTNEYIYNQTSEDKNILDDLENTVHKNIADGTQPAPLVLACLASYKALYDYSWSHLIALPDELQLLGKSQISDVKKEIVLRSEIPMLNEITDDVSSKVRQQYEENPYPRWVSLGLPLRARAIAEIAKSINLKVGDKKIYDCNNPQILVAGCGTGQHSIGTAARFKDCNVLAIDLSLSSLAYAKRKTEELGLKNIEYMQADILDLGKLGRQFDMVESAGVLHHMNDPMEGWSVLTNCLRPGGLMRIGLYSELARQHIVTMRDEIRLAKLGSDDFSMKSFRTDVINSDQQHHRKIVSSSDFNSLSTLRDLLFHVQEHRFTIPQIKNCLTELGLEFCGFEAESIVKQFKTSNVELENLFDLDKWNTFEQDSPNTFAGMYEFWCQKVL